VASTEEEPPTLHVTLTVGDAATEEEEEEEEEEETDKV
jgi:hypothetical protein